MSRRNVLSFPYEITKLLKESADKPPTELSFLQYHQQVVRVYFENLPADSKGCLIYHPMGRGKTLLAVSIAMDMIGKMKCIVLLTKSLQSGMRNAVRQYVALRYKADPNYELAKVDIDDWIDEHMTFVTANASNTITQFKSAAVGSEGALGLGKKGKKSVMAEQLEELSKVSSIDGKLLIVDEAHNLFRAITNGSAHAIEIYRIITESPRAKIIFLSGTPIVNDPFELAACFNMLAKEKFALLPETYAEFTKYFVDVPKHMIKNRSKFQNRVVGLVSYSPAPITLDASLAFPREFPLDIVRVKMDTYQAIQYKDARDKEQLETSFPGQKIAFMTRPKSLGRSTYRVKTRQLSNYAPSDEGATLEDIVAKGTITSPKFRAMITKMAELDGLGLIYSQFVGIGGLGAFVAYLKQHKLSQYETPTFASEVEKIAFKATLNEHQEPSIIEELAEPPRESAVDRALREDEADDTIDGGDEKTIAEELSDDDVSSRVKQLKGAVFAIATGDVDPEERDMIVSVFKSKQNMHGKLIRFLLISSTGAEGLDLHNVRQVHIMEPYWNYNRINQIKARAVRAGSHIDLPQKERNVRVFLYISILPMDDKKVDVPSTDEEIYGRALENIALIESFNLALQQVSIERSVGTDVPMRCKDGKLPFYRGDTASDMTREDPCVPVKTKAVSFYPSPFLVNGVKYYVAMDDACATGYRVYTEIPGTKLYDYIPEDNVYDQVLEMFMKHKAENGTKN